MTEHPASESSSDNFLPEPLKIKKNKSSSFSKITDSSSFLPPLDESPDFHDPYSDLSLFLSRKIKEEYQEGNLIKKWSIYLQEKLIAKIAPEFQKRFPKYKLGVNALYKTWKKIVYYSEQINSHKEALNQDGNLNISFLIKENLKQYLKTKASCDLYTYQSAYQLAIKISDCVATLDGIRPLLDHLAKTIWATQKHLLPQKATQTMKSPHDEIDKWDKLIIKVLLETTYKHPEASPKELETFIKEALQTFEEIPSQAHISALLAEKLYPLSSYHRLIPEEQKKAAFHFIEKHLFLYKKTTVAFNPLECARRLSAFYTLASKLPKNLSQDELANNQTTAFYQSLMAFFSQEARLLESTNFETIYKAYQETEHLPELSFDHLEMIIWKILSQQECLLQYLPYKIGQKIEEEIGHIIIDNPQSNFTSILNKTLQFFKKAQEITTSKQTQILDKKIAFWTSQGDLLCRDLHLDPDSALLQLICQLKQTKNVITNHEEFISEATQLYLREHPTHIWHAPQITARISILYKYAWYALFSEPEASSLDRFLEWHFIKLMPLPEDVMISQIEKICQKKIFLIPFDKEHCLKLFRRRQEEKIDTQNDKRHA